MVDYLYGDDPRDYDALTPDQQSICEAILQDPAAPKNTWAALANCAPCTITYLQQTRLDTLDDLFDFPAHLIKEYVGTRRIVMHVAEHGFDTYAAIIDQLGTNYKMIRRVQDDKPYLWHWAVTRPDA